MLRAVVVFFCLFVFFSCKKDKKPDTPAPQPAKTGTVNFTIQTYDSLGDRESDHSGVTVSFYQTGFSAVTNAAGNVSFNNVPYGSLLPVLQKPLYEGPAIRIDFNSSSVSDTLPCAKYSAYRLQNLSYDTVKAGQDSIFISFQLDRPVTAGRRCKIAVLFGDRMVDGNNYATADTISITSQSIQKLNVAFLPKLKASLDTLKSGRPFFIGAVPVSYGLYPSNILGKPMLVGDNPFFPKNITLNKNW